MTATGHALIATLLVAKFPDPFVSLPLAFVSHFACDIIPHWDSGTHHREKTKKALFYEAALDVLLSIATSFVLYTALGKSDYILLYIGVFMSQLPDWITAPYFILNMRNNPFVSWSKYMFHLQHRLNSRLDKPWGIVTQVAAVVGLYILLFQIF